MSRRWHVTTNQATGQPSELGLQGSPSWGDAPRTGKLFCAVYLQPRSGRLCNKTIICPHPALMDTGCGKTPASVLLNTSIIHISELLLVSSGYLQVPSGRWDLHAKLCAGDKMGMKSAAQYVPMQQHTHTCSAGLQHFSSCLISNTDVSGQWLRDQTGRSNPEPGARQKPQHSPINREDSGQAKGEHEVWF